MKRKITELDVKGEKILSDIMYIQGQWMRQSQDFPIKEMLNSPFFEDLKRAYSETQVKLTYSLFE